MNKDKKEELKKLFSINDEKIVAETYDHCKAPLIIQKIAPLNSMNRQYETEKLLKQNMHIEEIRKYDLD